MTMICSNEIRLESDLMQAKLDHDLSSKPVLWIRFILMRIRFRVRGSVFMITDRDPGSKTVPDPDPR